MERTGTPCACCGNLRVPFSSSSAAGGPWGAQTSAHGCSQPPDARGSVHDGHLGQLKENKARDNGHYVCGNAELHCNSTACVSTFGVEDNICDLNRRGSCAWAGQASFLLRSKASTWRNAEEPQHPAACIQDAFQDQQQNSKCHANCQHAACVALPQLRLAQCQCNRHVILNLAAPELLCVYA